MSVYESLTKTKTNEKLILKIFKKNILHEQNIENKLVGEMIQGGNEAEKL